MSSQPYKRETLRVFMAALAVSFSLIAYMVWYWDLVYIFPFYMLDVLKVLWIAFIGVGVWSLVHICRKRRYVRPMAYVPLAIQIVSVVIVVTVPFTAIMLDLNFKRGLEQREEVVTKVISGELTPNVENNFSLIHLSGKYRRLSKGGGDIIVHCRDGETYVFFYTFRGILDNFSGFMYRSDDSVPQDGDCGGEFLEVERLRKNWYWTAAHR